MDSSGRPFPKARRQVVTNPAPHLLPIMKGPREVREAGITEEHEVRDEALAIDDSRPAGRRTAVVASPLRASLGPDCWAERWARWAHPITENWNEVLPRPWGTRQVVVLQ